MIWRKAIRRMFHLPNTLVFTSTSHNNSLPEDGRIHLRINKARISPNADEVVKLATYKTANFLRQICHDQFPYWRNLVWLQDANSWWLIRDNLVTKHGENRRIITEFWDPSAMKSWLFWDQLVNIWWLFGERGDQSANYRLFGNCLMNKWRRWGLLREYFANILPNLHQIFAKSSPNCHQTFAKFSTVSPKYSPAVPHFQLW